MTRRRTRSLIAGALVGLGACLLTWVIPSPAQAGGVRVSIGIGIPSPVYVAPPPVIVHPAPVIVHPAPVIVQPAPRIVYPGVVYPPPAAFTVPYGVYGHPVPPVIVKKHRGYHPAHGYKFYKHKHKKHGW